MRASTEALSVGEDDCSRSCHWLTRCLKRTYKHAREQRRVACTIGLVARHADAGEGWVAKRDQIGARHDIGLAYHADMADTRQRHSPGGETPRVGLEPTT